VNVRHEVPSYWRLTRPCSMRMSGRDDSDAGDGLRGLRALDPLRPYAGLAPSSRSPRHRFSRSFLQWPHHWRVRTGPACPTQALADLGHVSTHPPHDDHTGRNAWEQLAHVENGAPCLHQAPEFRYGAGPQASGSPVQSTPSCSVVQRTWHDAHTLVWGSPSTRRSAAGGGRRASMRPETIIMVTSILSLHGEKRLRRCCDGRLRSQVPLKLSGCFRSCPPVSLG
jgi:hypothetical protein